MEDAGTIRILAVENDEVQRHLRVDIVSLFGNSLDLAATGKVAIKKLSVEQYDAVLTDVDLPDMSAVQVAQEDDRSHTFVSHLVGEYVKIIHLIVHVAGQVQPSQPVGNFNLRLCKPESRILFP